MAKKLRRRDRELVEALWTAQRREEEKELLARIDHALSLPCMVSGHHVGLLAGLDAMETAAYFKKPENTRRLAELCAERPAMFMSAPLISLFSKWCAHPHLEIALFFAGERRIKSEQRESRRKGSDETNRPYKEAEKLVLEVATDNWTEERKCGGPITKLKAMARKVRKVLEADLIPFGLTKVPALETVVNWIRPVAPKEASLGGRPSRITSQK